MTPAIARRVYNHDGKAEELSTFATWRRQAYFEFKDVPVKNKVYRYWYLRYREGGTLRSVYCGKVKPDCSAREAIDRIRRGYDAKALDRDSLNRPPPGPTLPKPEASSSSSRSPAAAPASPAIASSAPASSSSSSSRRRRSPARSSAGRKAGLGSADRGSLNRQRRRRR